MKTIMIIETNFAAALIRKMKGTMKTFHFDGGYLYFEVLDNNLQRAKSILGRSILAID